LQNPLTPPATDLARLW